MAGSVNSLSTPILVTAPSEKVRAQAEKAPVTPGAVSTRSAGASETASVPSTGGTGTAAPASGDKSSTPASFSGLSYSYLHEHDRE